MIDFLRHCPGVVCVPTAYHSTPQGDPHTRIDQSQLLGLFPCDLEVRLVPRENTLETTHPVVALLPEKL